MLSKTTPTNTILIILIRFLKILFKIIIIIIILHYFETYLKKQNFKIIFKTIIIRDVSSLRALKKKNVTFIDIFFIF